MTVIENLLVPPRKQFSPSLIKSLLKPESRSAERKRLEEAYTILDQLEVPHMAHNLTNELSGGQSKLVDIGRSMMGNPRLLLLDEPVAGVAGPLAMKIFNNLRRIVDETGISVLIIEHNMDFILRQGVDRIIVMNEGEVLMQGTPDEVRANREVIEAYLGSTGKKELERGLSSVLEIESLEGGYGSVQILYGIDMHVDEGEFVTIIGPNGYGKSTLIKTIFGIATHYGGNVSYRGENVSGWRTDQLVNHGIA